MKNLRLFQVIYVFGDVPKIYIYDIFHDVSVEIPHKITQPEIVTAASYLGDRGIKVDFYAPSKRNSDIGLLLSENFETPLK